MTLIVITCVLGSLNLALAQPGIFPGDSVRLSTVPPASQRGTTVVGNPTAGIYDILINGWIEAYAVVTVYDNWISFGIMDPMTGTFASPVSRYAFSQTGEANPMLPSSGTDWNARGGVEDGGQDPLYAVNGSTSDFDLAGLQIQTNARLDMFLDLGGFMRRVTSTGAPWAGVDNRRDDAGPYELANQIKMVFKGRFLDYTTDPDDDDPGTQYVSLVDGTTTDYNTWTDWATATNTIFEDDDWLWPVESIALTNDPWTGVAGMTKVNSAGAGGPWLNEQLLDLIVERGQAQGTAGGLSGAATPAPFTVDGIEAAELWFAARCLRRGLQDVQGNYRADMGIDLLYREADVQWVPPSK